MLRTRSMKFTYTADAKPVDGYTIRRGIHRGGFGEVYYAVSDAGKEVALKLLTHDLDTELRGVRQCLNLKHPNLVTTFDVKTDADGDHWVIMEYIQGASLEDVLRSFPHGLPETEVTAWMRGLLDGVEFLHQRGIVHRDLKPANVYRENGHVKIGDVGLSKQMGGGRRNQHTEAVGTVYYMAPEVAKGQYGPEVDVYSLGVMLYEMVTGRLPFDGETTAEILMKHLSSRPDLSLLPVKLVPVIAHALEKDPTKRTPTVAAFRQELRGLQAAEPLPESAFFPPATETGFACRGLIDTNRGTDTDRRRTPLPVSRHSRNHHAAHSSRSQSDSTDAESLNGWKIALIIAAFVFPFPFLFVAIAVFFGPWLMTKSHDLGRAIRAFFRSAWPWLLVCGIVFIPWHRMHWGQWSANGNVRETVGIAAFWLGLLWAIHRLTKPAANVMPSTLALVAPPTYSRAEIWAASTLTGTIAAALFAFGGWLACCQFFPPHAREQLTYSAATYFAVFVPVIATVTMLTAAIAGSHFASWTRWGFGAIGLAIGAMVGGLHQFLEVELHPYLRHDHIVFDHIGSFALSLDGQPTIAAFMAFFGLVVATTSWPVLLKADRVSRICTWPVMWSAGVGYMGSFLFGVPAVDAIVWAGSLSAAAQIAAPWQPKVAV